MYKIYMPECCRQMVTSHVARERRKGMFTIKMERAVQLNMAYPSIELHRHLRIDSNFHHKSLTKLCGNFGFGIIQRTNKLLAMEWDPYVLFLRMWIFHDHVSSHTRLFIWRSNGISQFLLGNHIYSFASSATCLPYYVPTLRFGRNHIFYGRTFNFEEFLFA